MAVKCQSLFGGTASWHAVDWTASDDRVRGGSSQSYLDVVPLTATSTPADAKKTQARFHGTLDTTTLGGAGFASQRTTSTDTIWDLSTYAGIELVLHARAPPSSSDAADAAPSKYTFNLKDTLSDTDPDSGREQATVSWEVDFTLPTSPASANDRTSSEARDSTVLRIPWADFKPTYRGREKKDAGKLNVARIRRFSIMMRSFFDEQHGPFELFIEEIAAYKEAKKEDAGGLFASLGRCLGWRL